jgi:NAD(P)-dependent dehydrogenase (short-subunit alcohol dehydrogenase family)
LSQVIIITGASSGFGNLTARLLSQAGHTVYAGIRSHDIQETAAIYAFAAEHKATLRTVILDVLDTDSVNAAVSQVLSDCGRIDTIIHNAGHGCLGPAEAFTPEQLLQYVDVNVAGTQRLNRAALPHMQKAGKGTLVWVSSSSCRGSTPPFLGPYFAAKAAMDSMAVSYTGEVARGGLRLVSLFRELLQKARTILQVWESLVMRVLLRNIWRVRIRGLWRKLWRD